MSQDTLAQLEAIQKSFNQPAGLLDGLQGVNLDPKVRELYPVNTPLLKMIPRVVDGYTNQSTWKVIKGIEVNQGSFGVPEGLRGQMAGVESTYFYGKFAGLGKDTKVTYEAHMSAEKFIDILALAKKTLWQNVAINEEKVLYGGNGTVALAQAAAPVLSTATTGGTLAATTAVSVIVVALTHKAYNLVKPSTNGQVGRVQNLKNLKATVTYTTGDKEVITVNGGTGQASAATSITTGAGAANSITATVAPVAGAAGYAWFWGTAGAEKLGAVTFLNSTVITANAPADTPAATVFAADNSKDELVYDGIVAQIVKANSGSYVKALNTGATLTSDGAGGINEIEDALASFWDSYQIVPDKLIVSANVFKKISQLVIANNGAPLVRFNTDLNGGDISGGSVIAKTYVSKITGKVLDILVHPEAIEGSILFYTNTPPVNYSNTGNILEVSLRRDYYEIPFAQNNRTFQFGIYLDGLLKCYMPQAFGLIYNIAV
jgi:hypothetical protein